MYGCFKDPPSWGRFFRWLEFGVCYIPCPSSVSCALSPGSLRYWYSISGEEYEMFLRWVSRLRGFFRYKDRSGWGISMAENWLAGVKKLCVELFDVVLPSKENNRSACWAYLQKPAQMAVLVWTETNLNLTWGYEIRSGVPAGEKKIVRISTTTNVSFLGCMTLKYLLCGFTCTSQKLYKPFPKLLPVKERFNSYWRALSMLYVTWISVYVPWNE